MLSYLVGRELIFVSDFDLTFVAYLILLFFTTTGGYLLVKGLLHIVNDSSRD